MRRTCARDPIRNELGNWPSYGGISQALGDLQYRRSVCAYPLGGLLSANHEADSCGNPQSCRFAVRQVRGDLNGVTARWRKWSSASASRKIFSASLLVGSITAGVSLVGLAREAVVARTLGLGDEVDAFVLALALATFPVSMVAGAFHSILVPAYLTARQNEGVDAARSVAGALLGRTLLWLCVVMAILAIFVPILLPAIAQAFSAEKLVLTITLFHLLLPGLWFSGVATVLGGVLQAGEKFTAVAVSPVSVHILVLLILIGWGEKLGGGHALAVGTAVGYCIHAIWLGALVYARNLAHRPALRGTISWSRQAAPLSMWIGFHSVAHIMVLTIAASLGPGAVAAYNYGMKLPSVLAGMVAGALTQASLPYLSTHAAQQDWEGLQRVLRRWTQLILVVGLPVVIAPALFSESIVNWLFQGGAFSTADARMVGWIQAALFLHVPFFVLTQFQSRFLIAIGLNASLMLAGAILLAFTVIWSVPLSFLLDAPGLGLAVGAAFACLAAWYGYFLKRAVLACSTKLSR